MEITNEGTNVCKLDPTVLKLSVSKDKVHSKEDGKKKIDFRLREFDLADPEKLLDVLRSRNYSTNTWSGTCHADNYVGMTGLTLDFDGGMTIDEARIEFSPYIYVIHTSTNHRVEKEGVVADRFRVILPMTPSGLYFTTASECRLTYNEVLEAYPAADSQCKDPARKYFPFTGGKDRFEYYINISGEYFTIPNTILQESHTPSSIVFNEEQEGINGDQPGLMKMVRNCPIIRRFEADPTWVDYNQWLGIASNYACFRGGKQRFSMVSKRDKNRFDEEKLDQIFHDFCSTWHGPQTYQVLKQAGIAVSLPAHAPSAPAAWRFVDTKEPYGLYNPKGENYISHQEELQVYFDGEWQITDLAELKSWDKLQEQDECIARCTNCSGITAKVSANQLGFVSMRCPECKWVSYEYPVSPGMFVYMSDLYRVETRSDRFISFEKLKAANFRTADDWDLARHYLFNVPDRKYLSDSFQICRIGDASLSKLGYRLEPENNRAVFEYPAVAADVKDNAFIDKFLLRMFGEYTGFIKEWMAIYSYTNFQQLPVIVLTGPRGCGKNTFAQMVGAIFPALVGLWNGDSTHFNEQYTKKLLFVDENPNADKVTQYTEIKKITGNEKLKIDEKYKAEYYVPNNVHVIITTNDHRPIFVKWQEEPQSPQNNNFFIEELPDLPHSEIDNQLGDKLRARLGHYVRTELREVYERLRRTYRTNSRYGIDAPMTAFAKALYRSAKTSVEEEAEELAEYIVRGVETINPWALKEEDRPPKSSITQGPKIDFEAVEHNGKRYIQPTKIRRLVQQMRYQDKQHKKYVEALVRAGVISMNNDFRSGKTRLGHEILREKDYYDQTDKIVLYRIWSS